MKTVIRSETEMKDSGLRWLGEIPNDWKVSRVGNFFSFSSGDSLTNENIRNEGMYLVYGANGIRGYYSKYNLDKKRILLGRVGALAGNVNIVDGKVWVTEHALIASNKLDLVEEYYGYVFESMNLIQYSKSSAQPVISGDTLQKLRFPVPKLPEQQAIANYLDKTCSKIDEIIIEEKASIDEYKELKQSIIFEAVTKGLDKNVDMRDSGVEWIGAIPKTWDVLSLKYMCTMQAGKNLISEQIADSGKYSVYGGNGLRGYYSSYNTEGRHLLVGRQGALCGNVHDVDGQYWCTEHAIVTTETKFSDIDYLFYLLIGMNLNQYASNAAAQPGLSVGNILNVKTVKPSMDEQKEIATYLKNILPKYNSLITEKESLINDLEAYKKSLIYEVVTGKRRVV